MGQKRSFALHQYVGGRLNSRYVSENPGDLAQIFWDAVQGPPFSHGMEQDSGMAKLFSGRVPKRSELYVILTPDGGIEPSLKIMLLEYREINGRKAVLLHNGEFLNEINNEMHGYQEEVQPLEIQASHIE